MTSKNKGITFGLTSGVLWAIDTILIGLVLSANPILQFHEIAVFAPLLCTFLHDSFSSIWIILYLSCQGKLFCSFKKIKSKSGLYVIIAALLGGPIGMGCYTIAVQQCGASLTASISAIYPAVGALFAFLILKDRLSLKNWLGLLSSIIFIILLSYSENMLSTSSISIGMLFLLFCICGWAMECVVLSYGMKDDEIAPVEAFLIRQIVSAVIFGFIIIPILIGHTYTVRIMSTSMFWTIGFIALAGTFSYICYYHAIKEIGPVRAMALNISYSAWSIFLSVFLFREDFPFEHFIYALFIILGSIVTVFDFKEERRKINESDYIGSGYGNKIKTTYGKHS